MIYNSGQGRTKHFLPPHLQIELFMGWYLDKLYIQDVFSGLYHCHWWSDGYNLSYICHWFKGSCINVHIHIGNKFSSVFKSYVSKYQTHLPEKLYLLKRPKLVPLLMHWHRFSIKYIEHREKDTIKISTKYTTFLKSKVIRQWKHFASDFRHRHIVSIN